MAANSSVAPSENTRWPSTPGGCPWLARVPCRRACRRRRAGHGELNTLGGPGHPEVDHPRPVGRHQHVRRFQVPVHQPGAVDRLQRLRAPGGEPPGGGHGQRAGVPHQSSGQRWRWHVGGGQPRQVGLGVRLDDRRGEDAADLPRGRHLPREPGAKPASSASSTLIVLTATSRPAVERRGTPGPSLRRRGGRVPRTGPIRSGSHLRSVARTGGASRTGGVSWVGGVSRAGGSRPDCGISSALP